MKTIKLIAITVLAVAYTHLGSATETMSAPKRSDYESFKDYWDARVAWKAEQKNIEPQNISERKEPIQPLREDFESYREYSNAYKRYTEEMGFYREAKKIERCANADIRMTIGQRAKNLPCVAERVDRTTTKYGVREMWKYGSGYIWVEDGVVTAISGD